MDFTAVIIWTGYKEIPEYESSHASMPRENGFLQIIILLKMKIKPIPKSSSYLCDMTEPKTGVATS